MQSYEYRVLSAPRRGAKVKGVRAPEDRLAHAVEGEMNRMAAEGWDYVRSDTLPSEERPGWFSAKTTVLRTVLVFRRAVEASIDEELAQSMVAPPMAAPFVAPPAAHAAAPAPMAPVPERPAPLPTARQFERPAPPLAAPVAAPVAPAPLPASRFAPPPPAPAPAAGPAVPSPPLRRPPPQPAPPPDAPPVRPAGAPPVTRPATRLPLEDLLSVPEPRRERPPE